MAALQFQLFSLLNTAAPPTGPSTVARFPMYDPLPVTG
eukprot:COSAG05_NODE_20725_length_277_cov_0.797753_1_plen_37_part_01